MKYEIDKTKRVEDEEDENLMICQECGCVFDFRIAKRQQQYHEIYKLKCPCCREIILKL